MPPYRTLCAVKDETEHRCRPLTDSVERQAQCPPVYLSTVLRIVLGMASWPWWHPTATQKKWPGKGKKPGATDFNDEKWMIQSLIDNKSGFHHTQRQEQMPSFHEGQHAKRKEGRGLSFAFLFLTRLLSFPMFFFQGVHQRGT